jgi:hypothetical protein
MSATKKLTDEQIADLAGKYGEFSPSVRDTGIPQYHAGLPGVIKFARALLQRNAQRQTHPDTDRLNHIIDKDRCAIGYLDCWPATGGVIEKIEFIFENPAGDIGPDVVRSAIDNSIQADQRGKGDSA